MTRPHLPPQPPLTNEQKAEADRYALFVQQTRQAIEAAHETLELRKWCVEKALEGTHKAYGEPTGFACVALAREVYEFIAEPSKKTMDEIAAAALAKKDR